jgi:UDP-N-acetylglucosamine 2-epimerase (non-hydrolysing)
MPMNICIFCGARPNFIKVAPIIRAIDRSEHADKPTYRLVYAGPENDSTLEKSLFNELGIKCPDEFLGVDCENLNELTGRVMSQFELYLQQYSTDAVIVVDDLASTMAASIVTKKQGILLAHIAAGTRSFDITMPKEINRLVIDGLSDILFTAGISNNSIANKEGAELSKVYTVGNILMDNLRYNHERIINAQLPAEVETAITVDGHRCPYLVFTLNRKALLADSENLYRMLSEMLAVAGDTPVIAPLREPAKRAIMDFAHQRGLDLHNFHIVSPMGYLEFSRLTAEALGIITDSGNVAEEATFNQVACITLNSYTEHIETVKVGTNVLVGEDAAQLAEATDRMVRGEWKKAGIPDRWDGRTAERIIQIMMQQKI